MGGLLGKEFGRGVKIQGPRHTHTNALIRRNAEKLQGSVYHGVIHGC